MTGSVLQTTTLTRPWSASLCAGGAEVVGVARSDEGDAVVAGDLGCEVCGEGRADRAGAVGAVDDRDGTFTAHDDGLCVGSDSAGLNSFEVDAEADEPVRVNAAPFRVGEALDDRGSRRRRHALPDQERSRPLADAAEFCERRQ
jgi:hypothetical protein